MSKYELTISADYVPDWGVVEAVRELFQNALDQETSNPTNKMFFSYDEQDQVLEIGNKHSTLEASSLLLGKTSKANDDLTIGQFGEGYKLAMLILLREDLKVTVYNYNKREVWNPRFVNSRKYNGEKILTVFTSSFIFTNPPTNSLIIKIEGVTKDMYDLIVESNLHLRGYGETLESNKGKVLKDPDLKGKVFVSGLFVVEYTDLEYGYDFPPHILKLKRDRSMVSSFDIKSKSADLWDSVKDQDKSTFINMIMRSSNDTSHYWSGRYSQGVKKEVYDAFKLKNGENAIALSSSANLKTFMEEHPEAVPVVVASSIFYIISEDDRYQEDINSYFKEINRTTSQKLKRWGEKVDEYGSVSTDLWYEFDEILEEVKELEGK